ncbi:MAG: phage scaffolding protein [Clostridium perfringens]|nr:phage scaffolding protein [Clostridium perfringens]
MKRKFLEDLGLEKEVIDKIMAENGSDIEAEKAKTVEVTTKLESANSQLKEANNTITNLKKNNSNNEELQAKVKEYENTIKTQKTEYETKVRNLTLDSAINNALTKAKAKHSDLLASKFDRDKLVINEDGTVTGLDEQLKGFKETYKDMFEVTLGGATPPNPENKPTVGNSWEDFINNADNMSAEQIAEAYSNLK